MSINIFGIESSCACVWCEEALEGETIVLGANPFHQNCFCEYMKELETVQPLNFDEDDYSNEHGWN